MKQSTTLQRLSALRYPKMKARPRDVVVLMMFVFVILLVSASSSWCVLSTGDKGRSLKPQAAQTVDQKGDSSAGDAFILVENQKGRPPERSDISNTFKDKVKKVIEKQSGDDLLSTFRQVKKIITEKQEGDSVKLRRFVSTFIAPQQHHRREKLQMEGEGSVFEGWEGGHKIKDGLAEQTWQENKDWEDKKKQVKGAMMQICAMFNELLTTKVFPGGLSRRFIGGNEQFRVVDTVSGRCVSLKKWISFVNGSIATQMGYTKGAKTMLAKYVPLAFDSLDATVKDLPPLLTDDDSCALYRKGVNGVEDDEGRVLSYTVIWPVDGSVLIEYKLRTAA